MKKQNLAVFLSSLMLLATLVPTLVAAQSTTQEGELTLTGDVDIFFEGYDPVAGLTTPDTVTFTGLNTSSSDQETTLAITADAWTDTQFIGIMDLADNDPANDTWSLAVEGPADFTGTGFNQFVPTVMEAETSTREWAAAPAITCNGGAGECEYQTVLHGTGATENLNIAYYVDGTSSYTWTEADVTAPLNNADGFTWASSAFDSDISAGEDILINAADNGELGLFGTGINFNVGVPGGTGADTYTGTITYTLTIS